MSNYPYPLLERADMIWSKKTNQTEDIKVSDWIDTVGEVDPEWSTYDVTILGVPLSKSSISTSSASENPEMMRQAWKYFGTYNLDEDLDLTQLKVIDVGNVKQHITNILETHENIKQAMIAMRKTHSHTIPLVLGGDHSITAMLVKGWKEVHSEETIGILQLDSHFDLRDTSEMGPANGTPIRQLIEAGIVKGEHVHNIGLHGFFNARALKVYADQEKVNYMTMKQARKKGITNVIHDALNKLEAQVDTIYLTVDMDVLDIIHGPATPAAAPGGMYSEELFEAVQIAGTHPKVKAMDIVCLDPRKDVGQITVKNAVHTMLSFLVGVCQR